MWYDDVLLCPFCKGGTDLLKDKLARKLYRLCKECGRLVSKTACIKERRAQY